MMTFSWDELMQAYICSACGAVLAIAIDRARPKMRIVDTRHVCQPRAVSSSTMAEQPATDPINPSHYKGDLVMRIIERFALGFRLGNVVKYLLRHGAKDGLEGLKKARWYLQREIDVLEGKIKPDAGDTLK